MSKLTIIIPAYNEAQGLPKTLEAIQTMITEQGWSVIVVNDGSTDATPQILADVQDQLSITVLHHRTNRGYGAALKTGIQAAQTDFVATMDSDGQHRTEDMLALWGKATDYDLLIGQRTEILHSPLWRMPGKWLLQGMAIFLMRRTIPDLNSGMRVFRREVLLKYIHLFPNGFSFSTTSTMLFMNRGYAVGFHPIRVRARVGKSSVRLSTGLNTILLIIRLSMLLDPLRLFLPISFLLILVGVLWNLPFLLQSQGYSVGALLLIVTGIQIAVVALLSDQIAALRKERFE